MMKTAVRVLLWVGIALASLFASEIAYAEAASNSRDLPPHKLQVSGYHYSYDESKKTNYIDYIQLYNDSDDVVKLSEWAIYLNEVDDDYELYFSPQKIDGYIAPGDHVVLSARNVVGGSSYIVDDIELTDPQSFRIIIVPPSRLQLRAVPTEISPAKKYESKNHWTRSRTMTGYGSTFVPVDEYMMENGKNIQDFPIYDNGLYQLPAQPKMRIVEVYPNASDCEVFDKSVLCGDYVKLRLNGDENIEDYVLRSGSNMSRTASTTFYLEDAVLSKDKQYAVVNTRQDGQNISLTNTSGDVWLEDLYGLRVYPETYIQYTEGGTSRQGWSYAQFSDEWRWTYTPRPFQNNEFMMSPPEPVVLKPCPAGQYRNPETNRCRTIEDAVNALAACDEGYERNPVTNRCRKIPVPTVLPPCDEGYERNPLTNRCRKIQASSTSSLVPCKEGQERNPLTNRCRSIASAVAELLPCDEGYERNPATNRCRKVKGVATDIPVSNASAGGSTQNTPVLDPYALSAIGVSGVFAYGLYEWRTEIVERSRRLLGVFSRNK